MVRSKALETVTHSIATRHGPVEVAIFRNDDGDMVEVVARSGKSGDCHRAQLEGICALINLVPTCWHVWLVA